MANLCSKRQSGIELLRILAACGVVYGHYCNDSTLSINDNFGLNGLLLSYIYCLATPCVNIFVLVSGFYLSSSNRRTIGKPLSLLLQISFFSTLLYVLFVLLGVSTFSLKSLLTKILPINWFITLYVVLYILSPYINIVLSALTKLGRIKLMLIILFLFSVWPTLMGISEHFGYYQESLSTVGKGGNYAGFTLIHFVSMYSIGAIIKLNQVEHKFNSIPTYYYLLGYLICGLILRCLLLLPLNTTPWHFAGWYDNILVILMAVFAFLFFKRLIFSNMYVNSLAKAAFVVYIIHHQIFLICPTPDSLFSRGILLTFVTIVGIIILIYIFGWILHYIYNKLFGEILKKLDSKSIEYLIK